MVRDWTGETFLQSVRGNGDAGGLVRRRSRHFLRLRSRRPPPTPSSTRTGPRTHLDRPQPGRVGHRRGRRHQPARRSPSTVKDSGSRAARPRARLPIPDPERTHDIGLQLTDAAGIIEQLPDGSVRRTDVEVVRGNGAADQEDRSAPKCTVPCAPPAAADGEEGGSRSRPGPRRRRPEITVDSASRSLCTTAMKSWPTPN